MLRNRGGNNPDFQQGDSNSRRDLIQLKVIQNRDRRLRDGEITVVLALKMSKLQW
jgi:hypothetical protein